MNSMDRREFFHTCAGLMLSIGFSQVPHISSSLFSPQSGSRFSTHTAPAELLVIRGDTPRMMLLMLLESLGGIESFIQPGQRVVIKANFSFKRPPHQCATTNPELIETLVRECLRVGADEVIVLDHTIENERMCMDISGMKEAVERAGGIIKAINSSRDFVEIDIPRGILLKKTYFSKDVLDADVFINVPIAKHHISAVTTLSMKNLMGIVYDRGELHRRGLHQCIADLNTVRIPDLIILDAYRILMTKGPGGPGQIKEAGELIAGFDPVAIDTYGSRLLEQDPTRIGYIRAATDLTIGSTEYATREITCPAPSPEEQPAEQLPAEPLEDEPETVPSVAQDTGEPPSLIEEALPAEGKEKPESHLPWLLLIPALIVVFLIGIRMRKRKKSPPSHEDE